MDDRGVHSKKWNRERYYGNKEGGGKFTDWIREIKKGWRRIEIRRHIKIKQV